MTCSSGFRALLAIWFKSTTSMLKATDVDAALRFHTDFS